MGFFDFLKKSKPEIDRVAEAVPDFPSDKPKDTRSLNDIYAEKRKKEAIPDAGSPALTRSEAPIGLFELISKYSEYYCPVYKYAITGKLRANCCL